MLSIIFTFYMSSTKVPILTNPRTFSGPKSSPREEKKLLNTGMFENEVEVNVSTNLHLDYSSDHSIIITQPRPLKISSTWEKRFDHLLEIGGRRFRVILFRRRTRVSIPCKEMIGVKRFLPVLIYRQISRDCILNQQPH